MNKGKFSDMNFFDLYKYTFGKTEIPELYVDWSCISLIAAAAGRNVWHIRFRHSPCFPNMYVFLLGDSGSGKNVAIDFAGGLANFVSPMNAQQIKTSGPALLDIISREVQGDDPALQENRGRIYMISSELSFSIGTGAQAESTIKQMTQLFSGSSVEHKEYTRQWGDHAISKPMVNWLAGTNKDWLMETVGNRDVVGGFFARVIPIQPTIDYDIREYFPIVPADVEEAEVELRQRLIHINSNMKGEIVFEPDALEIWLHWYNTRESPDPGAQDTAIWKRLPEIMIKVIMTHALSNNRMYITPQDIVDTQRRMATVQRDLPELLTYANVTEQTEGVERAKRIIKAAKALPKSMWARKIGVRQDQFELIVKTLVTQKWVKLIGGKNMTYVFIGD